MLREKIDSCEITAYSGQMGKYKTDLTLVTETQQSQYIEYSLNRQIFLKFSTTDFYWVF
jgi:hypothetical protein